MIQCCNQSKASLCEGKRVFNDKLVGHQLMIEGIFLFICHMVLDSGSQQNLNGIMGIDNKAKNPCYRSRKMPAPLTCYSAAKYLSQFWLIDLIFQESSHPSPSKCGARPNSPKTPLKCRLIRVVASLPP